MSFTSDRFYSEFNLAQKAVDLFSDFNSNSHWVITDVRKTALCILKAFAQRPKVVGPRIEPRTYLAACKRANNTSQLTPAFYLVAITCMCVSSDV